MKNLSGRFCIVCGLFLVGILPSSAFAAKYSGAASRQFSADRNASEKPALPPEASSMPQEDLKAVSPITFDELRLFARDWLKANPDNDWTLPQEIVDKTINKYLQGYEMLTFKNLGE